MKLLPVFFDAHDVGPSTCFSRRDFYVHMSLHQIQASYRAEEDRVLLRVSFNGADGGLKEIRAWLTRRLLKGLWPGIIHAMETQVVLAHPSATSAKAEIVSMQHEATVTQIRSRGEFDKPFADDIHDFPLGEEAVLVVKAHISVEAKQTLKIRFVSAHNGSFEVAFNETMLHGLCSLLQDAAKKADWDFVLNLPGMPAQQWSERRVLN
jgi:hypothetical protein